VLQQISPQNLRELYYWKNPNLGNDINCLVPRAVSVSCPHCGVLNAMTFLPLTTDPHLYVISGGNPLEIGLELKYQLRHKGSFNYFQYLYAGFDADVLSFSKQKYLLQNVYFM
jgi:hypothetical protein